MVVVSQQILEFFFLLKGASLLFQMESSKCMIWCVARVRRRGEYSTSNLKYIYVYLSGKYGETRNSCLFSVKNGMGVVT